ncbi:MAG: alpha-galactosidase [Planctomycetota bacterium]
MSTFFTTRVSFAVVPSEAELKRADDWIQSSFVSGASYPFRFDYDGQSSAALLPTWEKSQTEVRLNENRLQHVTVFRDPKQQFEVRLVATHYTDFPAVEWVLHFKNIGDQVSPILKNILPLWTSVQTPIEGGPFDLRYALGSHNRSDDFQLQTTRILDASEGLNFSSHGGRSSDGHLPFFNLHHESGGVMLGIGWTGDWTMRFHRSNASTVNVVAGMPRTRLHLKPGEQIRSPAILLSFWDGDDPIRGHNLQRALLRKHFSPLIDGQPAKLPIAMSPHAVIPFEKITEQNVLEFIDRVAALDLPVETWWIDTGWFTMVDNHWAKSVGNFESDPVRFPNGMKPIGDAAHSLGWRFLLWQEPERVMPGTWFHEHHSQWLIPPPSDMPFPVKYMYEDGFHLLDLSDADAVDWLIETTSQLVADAGVDIYRNDCNIYPSYYWQKDEPADRVGMRESQYVAGLYRWIDALCRRHPHLLIDNCASGGRRIDFEMLRRSVVLWRSDMGLGNPIANQSISYGLAHWIPLWGGGGNPLDSYRFRSTLGPAAVISGTALGDPNRVAACKPAIAQYRDLRHLTEGDFYPLTTCHLRDEGCIAWQYDRPDLDEGLLQVFRRANVSDDSLPLKLRGLDPHSTYTVIDLDSSDEITTASGIELMSKGFEYPLAGPDTAMLYHYRESEIANSKITTKR